MNSKKFSLVIKKPIKNFKKKIIVDSDKSISIRSFLIGSISQGISLLKMFWSLKMYSLQLIVYEN